MYKSELSNQKLNKPNDIFLNILTDYKSLKNNFNPVKKNENFHQEFIKSIFSLIEKLQNLFLNLTGSSKAPLTSKSLAPNFSSEPAKLSIECEFVNSNNDVTFIYIYF